MLVQDKGKNKFVCFQSVFFTAAHVLYFLYKMEKCENYLCCSDLNRYKVNLKIKASHTHDFPPRNEPRRMYNGISPLWVLWC